MMIHEITSKAGKYKARKRVGRGPGSGVGKTRLLDELRRQVQLGGAMFLQK